MSHPFSEIDHEVDLLVYIILLYCSIVVHFYNYIKIDYVHSSQIFRKVTRVEKSEIIYCTSIS